MTAVCPCMASCLQDVFRFIPGEEGDALFFEGHSMVQRAPVSAASGRHQESHWFWVASRGPVLLVNVPALWEQGYFQSQ